METSPSSITPPPGYALEQPQNSGVTPPPGYTLEGTDTGATQAPEQPGLLNSVGAGLKKAGSDVYGAVTSIAPPTNTTAASTFPGKALGFAEDVMTGINNLSGITTVTNSLKSAGSMLHAYENARSSGGSIMDALHAANEQGEKQDAITPMVKERIAEFQKNPTAETVRALGDVVAAAAAIYGVHRLAVGSPAEVPAEDALSKEPATAASVNPIEAKTSSVVKKAGLPEGKSATSDVGVKQDIAKQNLDVATQQADEGKQIQGSLQKGIRDYWTNVAKDNEVKPPDPKLSIRDAGQQVGDDIIKQAKTVIKPLDDATGGKFSANDAKLQSVNQKLRRVSSIDDEDKLISEKQRLLWEQDDLLKQAKTAGVPDGTLDTFKLKYRTGQAIYDQNNHIRMTTSGLPPDVPGAGTDPEVVKSSNLLNRLVKDYSPEEGGKPGRLIQAGGEENAHGLLNSVSTAKVAENKLASSIIEKNPEFSTLPATDSKALREIVRPHVSAGKMFGTNADYKGILDDFDKMSPAELKARFSNPAEVRSALVKAQRRQTATKVLGVAGATATAGAAGRVGWNLTH